MNRKLLGAVALFAMFSAFEANAQGTSQDINVLANVPNVCVINASGTPLEIDFGQVDVDTLVDSTGSANLQWRCSLDTPVQIRLNNGDTPLSAPATARLLEHVTDNTQTISYLLCHDAACANPWGDQTSAPDLDETGQGMGVPVNTPIYGVLDAATAQNALAGDYSETVVVSLTF